MNRIRLTVEMDGETGAVSVQASVPQEVVLGILMAAWRNTLADTIKAEILREMAKDRPRIIPADGLDISRRGRRPNIG